MSGEKCVLVQGTRSARLRLFPTLSAALLPAREATESQTLDPGFLDQTAYDSNRANWLGLNERIRNGSCHAVSAIAFGWTGGRFGIRCLRVHGCGREACFRREAM